MNTTTMKETIENNLVYYYAGMSTYNFISIYITVPLTDEQYNGIYNVLASSQRDWDTLPCDSEKATNEQNKGMDIFLEKITNEIINIINH